jgi:hypothetical protein
MMKLTTRGRVVFGSLFLAIFVASGIVVLPPAFSPTKAEAFAIHEQARMRTLAKYENSDKLTKTELVDLLHAVGFKGEALRHAWAIVMKESRGNPLSHNGNRDTGDNSFGLFQINMVDSLGQDRREKFSLEYNAQLLNPVVNAKIAYHMSNGGKNWSAWKGAHTKVVKFWLAQFPEQKAKPKAKP